ncbi:serine and arginine rich splicing factor 7b [Danio rerio]|uniref:Serine and arginine-rich-splicing factor 7b n=1 Tax=Danio rerio TaxID=7955 RepID=Q4V8Q5_DANRE|nr:serine and arginine rich splicing factor 7b [Danio rerio]AAH97250.1 Splicing factor, arginine/serine-rich 7 [Danio rerio]|eukprot:NP_001025438.1 serine/arginine-rich splicing factor 7 [Danio rerio]
MSRFGRHGGETKVYVGNLGTGAGKGELERAFGYYGPLRSVWIARNPAGFAFVEFEDPRDAEDSVRGLDGKVICGSRVRVELSTGMPRRSRYDHPPSRRPFDPNDRCYECGEKGHYAYDCHRYSRRRRTRFHRLIQRVTILYDFLRHLANPTRSIACYDRGTSSHTPALRLLPLLLNYA